MGPCGSVEGHRFEIRDPKPRAIFAPCFRERVLHHALMDRIGPVLDRALINDSYACRAGKGTLAATARVHEHVRRFPWYAKMDVRAYFASIRHSILMERTPPPHQRETTCLLSWVGSSPPTGKGRAKVCRSAR